ncbi:Hypothetical protein CINCED_3A005492 [Cinara cedri]|uniref:Uncharacterized protein n=1 Tax=Cinara cedri TaxID=506608 RepID=A0A5E4NQE4_9HEMI|nr:Hypothetical protein CINCED_3A005492 [Cinara cedri]
MNTRLQVQEKAVSTDPEQSGDLNHEECRLHHILATMVNRKVIAIKADICETKSKWRIQPKLLVQKLAEKNSKNKRKLGRRRKGRCMHSCHKHHHHRHHHHHHHPDTPNRQLFHHHHHHCDGIVRQEEPVLQSEGWSQSQRAPVPYLGGHILTAALQRSTAGMSDENRHYIEVKNPKIRSKKKSRRTRFGHEDRYNDSNLMRPHAVHTLHPDDLPQRARWTIIITAGLLLITCMLLVGVTLRMAPVIDELVRNKNEELMNSLDREEYGPSENSTDDIMYR